MGRRNKGRRPQQQPRPSATATGVQIAPEPAQIVAEAVEPVVAAPEPVEPQMDALAMTMLGKSRVMNKYQIHMLLGVSRNVLDKWMSDPSFPPSKEGGRGAGNEYGIDIAELWRWREEKIRRELTKTTESGTSNLEDDLIRLKIAKEASLVQSVRQTKINNIRILNNLRQAFNGVPGRLGRAAKGFPKAQVDAWVDLGEDIIRQAFLKSQEDFAASVAEPSAFVEIEQAD